MIRFVFTAAVVAVFIWFGATVSLGKRTLFGHIGNIWSSDEAKEMRDDVKDTTAPVLDKAKKGAAKGWEAINKDDLDGGAPAPAPADAAP